MKTVVDQISKLQFICQTLFTAYQLNTFEFTIRQGMAEQMYTTSIELRTKCGELADLIGNQINNDNA